MYRKKRAFRALVGLAAAGCFTGAPAGEPDAAPARHQEAASAES